MTELKPCPCCGGDATCFAEDDGYRMTLGDRGGATTDGESMFRGVAGCKACGLGFEEWHDTDEPMFEGCVDPTEFEAVLEKHMAEKWNTRYERTCRIDDMECSACGHVLDIGPMDDPNYCPNCKAKVVGQ